MLDSFGTCSPPGSSVHGISQERILEWVACPFSRESSQPRNQTKVSCFAGRFSTSWATTVAQQTVENVILCNTTGLGIMLELISTCPPWGVSQKESGIFKARGDFPSLCSLLFPLLISYHRQGRKVPRKGILLLQALLDLPTALEGLPCWLRQ